MIPYGRQSVDEDDIAAVVAVLRSDWLTQGPKVADFEADLAAMVGGTRQRVNQILGEFADEGLVSVDQGGIVVRDVQALRNRAGW